MQVMTNRGQSILLQFKMVIKLHTNTNIVKQTTDNNEIPYSVTRYLTELRCN